MKIKITKTTVTWRKNKKLKRDTWRDDKILDNIKEVENYRKEIYKDYGNPEYEDVKVRFEYEEIEL